MKYHTSDIKKSQQRDDKYSSRNKILTPLLKNSFLRERVLLGHNAEKKSKGQLYWPCHIEGFSANIKLNVITSRAVLWLRAKADENRKLKLKSQPFDWHKTAGWICTSQGGSTIDNIGSTSFGNQRNCGCILSKIPVNPVWVEGGALFFLINQDLSCCDNVSCITCLHKWNSVPVVSNHRGLQN